MRKKTSQQDGNQSAATARTTPASVAEEQPAAAATLLNLQRAYGNHYVQRLLRSGALQPKLTVSEPGDSYEQEADRVAEQVMRMPERKERTEEQGAMGNGDEQIQRKCAACEGEETIRPMRKAGVIQRQAGVPEEDEEFGAPLSAMAQRKTNSIAPTSNEGAHQPTAADDSIDESRLTTDGDPLPQQVQTFYEDRFGRDFSDVRVHTGAESAERNQTLQAHAFTYGNHVWLGAEQRVEPSFILAHELTHVVQQRQPPLLQSKARNDAPASQDEASDLSNQ